jgi:hypothetical protein
MQASHTVTDVIPIVRFLSSQSPNTEFTIIVRQNEWEHVSEQALGFVLDHNTSNDLTPKIKCMGRDGVDPGNLVFELGPRRLRDRQITRPLQHNDEVETVTVQRGSRRLQSPMNTVTLCPRYA